MEIAALLFGITALLLLVTVLVKTRGPLKHLPGPISFPLIGSLHLYLWYGNIHDLLAAGCKKFGYVWRVNIGIGDVSIVSDPHMMREIAKIRTRMFAIQHDNNDQLDMFYNLKTDPLFNLKGEEWHTRRKYLAPMFAQNHIRGLTPIITESIYTAFDELWGKKTAPFDPRRDLKSVMLRTTGRTALGHEFKVNDPILTAVEECIGAQINELLFPKFMLYRTTKLKETVKKIDNFMTSLVQHYAQLEIEELFEKRDLLGLLVRSLKDDSDDGAPAQTQVTLTLDQIKDEAYQFLLAGYDTSAATTAWALYWIGQNQAVQNKVVDEMRGVFPDLFQPNVSIDTIREISYDQLSKKSLPYTGAAIHESQRLTPIAPIIDRKLDADINVCGYTLPKNSFVWLAFCATANDEKIWGDDANQFNPERWLEIDTYPPEKRQAMNSAMAPFGMGPRMCIGMQIAEISVRCNLAMVLSRWKVEVVNPKKVTKVDKASIEPKNLQIKLTPRKTE